jgi:predicted HTH domain antitoxin
MQYKAEEKPIGKSTFRRDMEITINIPDSIAQSADLTQTELLREIAVLLFQQERVTLGKAAQIARLHPFEFQKLLASRKISVHYGLEDYEADVTSLRQHDWR